MGLQCVWGPWPPLQTVQLHPQDSWCHLCASASVSSGFCALDLSPLCIWLSAYIFLVPFSHQAKLKSQLGYICKFKNV